MKKLKKLSALIIASFMLLSAAGVMANSDPAGYTSSFSESDSVLEADAAKFSAGKAIDDDWKMSSIYVGSNGNNIIGFKSGGRLHARGYGPNPFTANLNPIPELGGKYSFTATIGRTRDNTWWDTSIGVRFMMNEDTRTYYELYTHKSSTPYLIFRKVKFDSNTNAEAEVAASVSKGSVYLTSTTQAIVTVRVDGANIYYRVASPNGSTTYIEGTYVDPEPIPFKSTTIPLALVGRGDNTPVSIDDVTLNGAIPYLELDEPSPIIYKNVAANKTVTDGVMDLGDYWQIRRVSFGENTPYDISVSLDGFNYETLVLGADITDGNWLNTVNANRYRYLRVENGVIPAIYTDVYEKDNEKLYINDRISLTYFVGGTEMTGAQWSVSPAACAVIDGGNIRAIASGDAVVTVKTSANTSNYNLVITGEIEEAKNNDMESEFVESKRALIEAVNAAVAANDDVAMKAILLGTGENKLSSLRDYNGETVAELSASDQTLLAQRIVSYPEFKGEDGNLSIENIEDLIDTINTEIAVGNACLLGSTDEVATVLSEYNRYFDLDLTNKYYLNNKSDTLSRLINIAFKNLGDLQRKYVEAYIMSDYKNTVSFSVLGELFKDNKTDIGYDEAKYNAIKDKNTFYKVMLKQKSKIETVEQLKEAIDSYKESSSGDGGSGGGGVGSVSDGVIPSGGASSPAKPSNPSSTTITSDLVQQIKENSEVVAPLFNDFSNNHWAYEFVKYLKAHNCIGGYADGSFMPDNNITRAEFIKILIGAMEIELPEEEAPAEEVPSEESTEEESTEEEAAEEENAVKEVMPFEDTLKDDWFTPYFAAAKDKGIVLGSDNKCYPNDNITREEMAAIIYRALRLKGTELDSVNPPKSFDDENEISDWAYAQFMQLYKYDIINGTTSSTLSPKGYATRAQVSKTIASVAMKIAEKEAAANEE